jgi:hypothetical protein
MLPSLVLRAQRVRHPGLRAVTLATLKSFYEKNKRISLTMLVPINLTT